MELDAYISKSRIIDIKSTTFKEAIKELLGVCTLSAEEKRSKSQMLEVLMQQEKTVSTYLGNGIAIPHMRVKMKRPYIFALGRCKSQLKYEYSDEYRDIRLILLLLASHQETTYLNVLAGLARILQASDSDETYSNSLTLTEFRDNVVDSFKGLVSKARHRTNGSFNHLLLINASAIANKGKCSSIFIFSDTFSEEFECSKFFEGLKTIFITCKATKVSQSKQSGVIPITHFSDNRLSQLRSAIIIGLTHGIIRHDEKVCCIGGIPGSNKLDTIVVIDVKQEIQSVFTNEREMLPVGVNPEVLERLLTIATELSMEGREGVNVGCLFVLGNINELNPFIKPLVLNPFYGYKKEDRNILNPFMDETVKEFSSIDGAFIVGSDGVLEAAGSMVYAPNVALQDLPSGLGTRHAAAAAISVAVDCIALTVSSSTGQVTLFRKGKMLPLIDKGISASTA